MYRFLAWSYGTYSTVPIKLLVAKGHLCILSTARSLRDGISGYWKNASFYTSVEQCKHIMVVKQNLLAGLDIAEVHLCC